MKRSHLRYRARGGAMVAFSIPHLPPIATMRRLVDISRGGLSFCYISSERQELTASEVDLFWYKTFEPAVRGLPCRIVYDKGEGGDRVGYARFRRCGLQFGDLTEEQESGLEEFIQKHAEVEEA